MTKPFHSLSRRIIIQFCIFTLALSLLYSFLSFILMYTLEDSFIEKEIQLEIEYLAENFDQTGTWTVPRRNNMQLHFAQSTFPDDIRAQAIDEPRSKEFYGKDGRHFHVYPIENHNETYLVAEVSQDLMVRPIREGVIQFLVLSAILVTSIACAMAWIWGRKTTNPLKKLADLVDGAAPETLPEKFAHRFPNNEIGILARTLEHTFSRMAKSLERERCFTRDASHELRTPLAVIKNAAELHKERLEQKNQGISQDADINDRVLDAAEQMEKTVHTLLMLAREENASARKQITRLMPILEESVIHNSSLLVGKPIEVKVDNSCDVKVNVQPGMLKVLIDNLLSNAFQYTREGQVAVFFDNNSLIISDTGPGIEPTIKGNITEPAVKGEQSTGFGFGLSIVKRLCEHQNWVLSVSSSERAGTSISVEITN